MPKTVFMILADGFEDIEATTPLDVFRRLGINAITVGLESKSVKSAHGLVMSADTTLAETDIVSGDAIVLPGGLPGATNLRDSAALVSALAEAADKGVVTAAICAAPIVLEKAGLLNGRRATGYPGCEPLSGSASLKFTGSTVERDGLVVTGRGPGASFAFARAVAETLGVPSVAIDQLYAGMFVKE